MAALANVSSCSSLARRAHQNRADFPLLDLHPLSLVPTLLQPAVSDFRHLHIKFARQAVLNGESVRQPSVPDRTSRHLGYTDVFMLPSDKWHSCEGVCSLIQVCQE